MGLLKFLGVLSPAHINLFTALRGGDKVGMDAYGNSYYSAKPRKSVESRKRINLALQAKCLQ